MITKFLNQRIRNVILFLGLLFFFSGCSYYQITSEETTFDYHPPKSSKNDVLYMKQITQPYKLLGYVTVNTERSQKREYVIEKLKQEAAAIGGDAITNITYNDGTGNWALHKPRKLFANANIRINYMAEVVVFEKETDKDSSGLK